MAVLQKRCQRVWGIDPICLPPHASHASRITFPFQHFSVSPFPWPVKS
jgi:hypothetical protein